MKFSRRTKIDLACMVGAGTLAGLVALATIVLRSGNDVAPPAVAPAAQNAAPAPANLPPAAHPDRPVVHAGQVAPTFTAYRVENVEAISREADRVGLPPVLMLALGAQEGGLACPPVCPVGDLNLSSTGSCGTYQIYIAVHGGTCEQWQNPVTAMREMEPRWLYYFNLYGGYGAWLDDMYAFIARWAPSAQGSVGWDSSIARANVRVGLTAYIDYQQQRIARAESAPPIVINAGGVDAEAVRAIAGTLDELAIRVAIQAIELRARAPLK